MIVSCMTLVKKIRKQILKKLNNDNNIKNLVKMIVNNKFKIEVLRNLHKKKPRKNYGKVQFHKHKTEMEAAAMKAPKKYEYINFYIIH